MMASLEAHCPNPAAIVLHTYVFTPLPTGMLKALAVLLQDSIGNM